VSSYVPKLNKFTSVSRTYILRIPIKYSQIFANHFTISIKYKQDNLNVILQHNYQYNIHEYDTIIPNEIDGVLTFQERTDDKYTEILFDKVISIEMVPNTTNYAYDLTVADTRNFNLYNGILEIDTFHFAGVSSKSNVTRGVPRIEEILSLSSDPKNPSLTVYLKEEDETDRVKAQSIMYT
jgi:hypothetical protein